ncbi:uncharacterized protein A1O9_07869 [Exophiala aquamarina CBS 119918]|uniref:Uncharacterized protein n=1 Tax=Exophiala aquamarina CBS 119918 TaxID=1182545 RepID=A0A072PAL1_9EURO|nr:uncharacterized protein A1O9_07869 [Exophiala aquamarina CBS 119918]KEF56288.1 hypothetical protein A1O9_07869 [Exophiala aquamarina CBS 119918]
MRGDAPAPQAVRSRDLQQLQEILDGKECSLFSVTSRGDSLLHLAVSTNNNDMVTFLLQQEADINLGNDKGNTPLHVATANSISTEIVQTLLNAGANLDACNLCRRSPLHAFFNETTKSIHISAQFLDMNSVDDRNMTILHYVVWPNISTVDGREARHLKQNRQILLRDYLCRGMLHLAAQRGNLGIVQEFCSSHFAETPSQPDLLGRTPMHYAVESGRAAQVINLLLKQGLAPEVRDLQRRTPPHQAALHNNVVAIEALLSTAGNRDAVLEDLDHRAPFAVAQMAQSSDAARVLASKRCGPRSSRVERTRVRHVTLARILIWKCLSFAWKHKLVVALVVILLRAK